MAQWSACGAHNPKVPGSKPGSATISLALSHRLRPLGQSVHKPNFLNIGLVAVAAAARRASLGRGRAHPSQMWPGLSVIHDAEMHARNTLVRYLAPLCGNRVPGDAPRQPYDYGRGLKGSASKNVGLEPGDCDAEIDACGVRAHTLSEWRLEPPP